MGTSYARTGAPGEGSIVTNIDLAGANKTKALSAKGQLVAARCTAAQQLRICDSQAPMLDAGFHRFSGRDLTVRMLAAAFGFLATAAAPAADQPGSDTIPFDPALAMQRQQLSGLEEEVAECMFSIARLQLFTVGNQNRDNVQSRMIAICRERYEDGLTAFKIRRTESEINDFLVSTAGRALNLAASTGH